ncbi:hypothetical protein ACU635_50495 [[Actinomadura] parvosata]|uniref:hypothetical protein n=1 Tax=[Actinomadura] parvosata TaxID=1955412 RepID=UPI00406D15DB
MVSFASGPQCHVAWCRAWHRPEDLPGHAAQLAYWRIGGVTVELFVGQADRLPPIIRLTRRNEDGDRRSRDLEPELAADLADILEALPGRQRELVAALRTAAEALGQRAGAAAGSAPPEPVVAPSG